MKTTYQKIASYEATGKIDKVLLLYSGGLDTSVMMKWIMDKYKCDVYTLTLNIGQYDENFDEIKEKALNLGVKKAFVIDAQKEFATEYLSKAIKANADYQGGYHLYCPLGRAVIAKKAIEIAQEEGIKVIAHGATGKGNDQVRFDAYITTLDPSIKILAPVRECSMTRKDHIAYAKKHGIPLQAHSKLYSYDQNLWGSSAEGGEIEDVELEPNLKEALLKNSLIENAATEPSYVELKFDNGLPVAMNGKKLNLVSMIKALAALGAAHGVGTKIFVEDRVVGLKVRGVYEQPAAEILVTAHKELEKIVSTGDEYEFKQMVDMKWGSMCYKAKWYEPLMANLNSFIDCQNKKVCGVVKLKVFKGNVDVVSVKSKYSMIDANLCSFDTNGFNQNASAGFIEHYAMQMQMSNAISKN